MMSSSTDDSCTTMSSSTDDYGGASVGGCDYDSDGVDGDVGDSSSGCTWVL